MKINYSLLFLILFSLYIGYFDKLLLFIVCLLIHEIGHLIFIKLFKVKINSFTLSIYGGLIDINYDNLISLNKYKKIIIYSSGTFMNLIFYILFNNVIFGKIHLIMLFFNLLPIFPLDGFNIYILLFNKYIVYNLQCITLFVLLVIGIYYKSIGIIIIFLVLFFKVISYFKRKDKIYLYKIIKNMV